MLVGGRVVVLGVKRTIQFFGRFPQDVRIRPRPGRAEFLFLMIVVCCVVSFMRWRRSGSRGVSSTHKPKLPPLKIGFYIPFGGVFCGTSHEPPGDSFGFGVVEAILDSGVVSFSGQGLNTSSAWLPTHQRSAANLSAGRDGKVVL